MTAENTQKIQELLKKIKTYSRASTFSSNKLKGEAQMELYKYTKDQSHLKQAINSFSEAMEKNKKKDSVVLCLRAKAYNALGQTELAVEDFRQAQLLSATEGGDILKNFHTQNMMKQIAKLDSVKGVIDKMRQNKELSPQFLNAFTDLTNVTQRCVVKLGVHQDRLNDHDDVLLKLTAQVEALQKQVQGKQDKSKVQQIQNKMEKYLDLYKNFEKNIGSDKDQASVKFAIKQLQQKMKGLQGNVKVVQARVQKVEIKLDKFMHHNEEQFNKIKSQLKNMTNNIEAFNGKFKYFETQIDSVKQKVVYIDQALKQSLYPKKQVKDQLDKWKKEDKQIYQYANNFYWLFNNYLLSYRMASTGMFEGKQPNPTFLQKHFKSIVDVVASALSIIPIVSEGVDIIKGIVQFLFDEYVQRKFQLTVQKMNNLTKYHNEQDMSHAIGKAVVSICKMAYKIKQIRKVNNKKPLLEDDPLTQARDWLNQKVDGMVQKATNIKVQQKTPIYQLALEDVTLFIGYVLTAQLDKNDPISTAIKQAFDAGDDSDSKINRSLINLQKRKRKGLVTPKDELPNKTDVGPQKVQEGGCCFIY